MTGLGATGLRLFRALLARQRLRCFDVVRDAFSGRRAKHKLDQFFLRQTLQIATIHGLMGSGMHHADQGRFISCLRLPTNIAVALDTGRHGGGGQKRIPLQDPLDLRDLAILAEI